MTDARLRAEGKQDTAQPPADAPASPPPCPTGTHVLVRGAHRAPRGRGWGPWDPSKQGFRGPTPEPEGESCPGAPPCKPVLLLKPSVTGEAATRESHQPPLSLTLGRAHLRVQPPLSRPPRPAPSWVPVQSREPPPRYLPPTLNFPESQTGHWVFYFQTTPGFLRHRPNPWFLRTGG